MKKIHLSIALFVALLVCWAGAYAQTYFCGINTANQDCPINNNMYTPEITIGFFPNAALTYRSNFGSTYSGHLIYNYNASSVQSFDLPDRIYVNDMDQVDDQSVAVFCGYKWFYDGTGTYTEGILGWFDPNNPTNYYIMQFPNVETFERVVGYEWNSQMHLVATGTHDNGGWIEDIIYVDNITLAPATNKSYTHYLLPQGQVTADIVKTRNYVVFVDAAADKLYLRRELYSDMYNGPELANYYVFPTMGGEAASRPIATYLGNTLQRRHDTIAMGVPEMYISALYYESHYYTFDIANMQMTNAQKFKLPEKMDLFGISYVEDSCGLAVLHRGDPVTGNWLTPVIMLDPYPTANYTANFFIDPNNEFHTISNLNCSFGTVKHLVLGTSITGGYHWSLRSNQCGTNTYQTCNDRKKLNITNVDVSTPTVNTSISPEQPLKLNVVPYQIIPASHGPVSTGCINN